MINKPFVFLNFIYFKFVIFKLKIHFIIFILDIIDGYFVKMNNFNY